MYQSVRQLNYNKKTYLRKGYKLCGPLIKYHSNQPMSADYNYISQVNQIWERERKPLHAQTH